MPEPTKIESRQNPRLKAARDVKDGRNHDLIFVEGLRLAGEVLRSDLKVAEIFYTSKFAATDRGQDFLSSTRTKFGEAIEVSEKAFDSIADTKRSQGIVVICNRPKSDGELLCAKALDGTPFVSLLHEINNPTNLGAILRTAEAAGISGVIVTKNSANPFSPKALRGSMGAGLRIPIWESVGFDEAVTWAKKHGLKVIGTSAHAPKSYSDFDWRGPIMLVFGSEAHGMSEDERKNMEDSVVIPMTNNVESLNIAVAAGILLFEAKRQREIT